MIALQFFIHVVQRTAHHRFERELFCLGGILREHLDCMNWVGVGWIDNSVHFACHVHT